MSKKWYGTAGSSMSTTSFNQKYASTATVGRKGEVRAENILKHITDGDTIGFSSVKTPSEKYNSDIDFVLLKGNRVLLVDAKLYKQGGFYWSWGNRLWHNFSVAHRDKYGNPKQMSKNMGMAKNLIQQKLGPNYVVEGIVLFTKANDRSPNTNVMFARWDGGVKSVNEHTIINAVNKFFRRSHNSKLTAAAEQYLASLTQ